jgi:LuxR family maltose regulon positive regulatory protein
MAWIYHTQHNLQDVGACLQKIEALKAASQPNFLTRIKTTQGHYEALHAFLSYMATDGEQALNCARRACEMIPKHHKRARVFANIFQLGAYQMLGDLETGLSIYKEVMEDRSLLDSGYKYMFMVNLCFVYWMDADLISLLQTAEYSLVVDHNKLLPEASCMANYFMGVSHYFLNDLDRAEEKLSRVTDKFCIYNEEVFAFSSFVLALVYQARGEPGKARKSCEAVVIYAIETDNNSILQFAQAFKAELALRQGRLAETLQWTKHFNAKPFWPTYFFYMPQLTLVKIFLAQDTTESRQQATDLLDELHVFQSSIHSNVFLIDILALQALLHDTRREEQAALDKLREAIALAEPGGFIRVFVDMGPRMAYLLTRLIRQNTALEYIGRILAAFRAEETGMVQGVTDDQTVRLSSSVPQPLFDPLTRREIEILDLLTKRLRNKEIAEKLFISIPTVKSHLTNIYQKLNVKGRQQAVDKSGALGIFSR